MCIFVHTARVLIIELECNKFAKFNFFFVLIVRDDEENTRIDEEKGQESQIQL